MGLRLGVAPALMALLTLAAAGQHLPFLQHSANDFRSFGKITLFHLDQPLSAAAPASLDALPVKSFTYSLYPTAGSGQDGMIPGDTQTGAPLMIPVAGGMYDHRNDPNNQLEFEISRGDVVTLPKAPGGKALLVYGALYSGANLESCTGVVQVLELKAGKLLLTDQISYDCRGGAAPEWNGDKRQLTVRSARYSLGDKPCCPSQYDSVVFKLDGEKVKIGDVTINDQ
jgi:hypothetical protein